MPAGIDVDRVARIVLLAVMGALSTAAAIAPRETFDIICIAGSGVVHALTDLVSG